MALADICKSWGQVETTECEVGGGGGESVRVKMRVPVVKAEGKGQRVEG